MGITRIEEHIHIKPLHPPAGLHHLRSMPEAGLLFSHKPGALAWAVLSAGAACVFPHKMKLLQGLK